MKKVDQTMVKVSVSQVAVGQKQLESLGERPTQSVQPEVVPRGSFKLMATSRIISAWLLKEKMIAVVIHVNDEGCKTSSITSIDLRTGVGRNLKTFSRAITLASFDEERRLVGVYLLEESDGRDGDVRMKGVEPDVSPTRSIVRSEMAIYRFDETYQQLSMACKQFELVLLSGEAELSHMVFLPGCHLVGILDVSNRIRFFHVRQQCILGQSLQLPSDFRVSSLLATDGGQCMMAISERNSSGQVQVIPYISPSFIALSLVTVDVAEPMGDWAVAKFGGQLNRQEHLCFIGSQGGEVWSHVIRASSRAQSQVITQQGSKRAVEEDAAIEQIKVTFLEYLFYVFDKFPVVGAVKGSRGLSGLKVEVLFDVPKGVLDGSHLPHYVRSYLEGVCNDLRNTKKPMQMLDLLRSLSVGSIVDEASRFTFRVAVDEPVG